MTSSRGVHPRWDFLREAGSSADDLRVAAEAALAGGRAAMERYGQASLDIEEGGRGPVTAADRASHRAIIDLLAQARPDEVVLSEEGNRTAQATGRCWVVDPLDGTQEFILKIGEFSVMVGLAIDGRAVLGAVFRPDPGILYLGITNGAAWSIASENGSEPRQLRVENQEAEGIRFVRSRSHPDERLQRLERELEPIAVVLSGSVGTKCAMIAQGDADLYVHPVPYLNEWDTCAPEAVLRGAGGRVTDCLGAELRYGKPDPRQPAGIFAAPPVVWDRVAPQIFDIGRSMESVDS
jgi:3'(2'), 5'-bisphosphate nucleotidase